MKNSELKYYPAPNFKQHSENVDHGFFTRLGGASIGEVSSLNCGFGSQDDPEKIQANRSYVATEMGVDPHNLCSTYQVHGAEVVQVQTPWDSRNENRPKADAMITDQKGIALGILTGDCTPVLFYGEKECGSPVVGAAHAGWRGALSGVLENTTSAMIKLGVSPEAIKACIGPCIAKQSYEVQEDFVLPFLKESDESERFFAGASKTGHLIFDLAGYCAWRLYRGGVKDVSILDKDTYQNKTEFYSYRRSTHREEADYGRQISVITIKS